MVKSNGVLRLIRDLFAPDDVDARQRRDSLRRLNERPRRNYEDALADQYAGRGKLRTNLPPVA